MKLANLSDTKLQELYDREDAVGYDICNRMIAAGRGHEKIADTILKDDPLSLEQRAHVERWRAIVAERNGRAKWGSMHYRKNMSANAV